MSEPAELPGQEKGRSQRAWSLRAAAHPWTPILVGLGIALLSTLTWVQWSHPYLEHDDWDMLLPNGPTFVENHAARLLHEGRWLNEAWWILGSQSLGPRTAVLLFTLGWVAAVAVLVRSFAIGWWSIPAVVALYAAPMMSMLSFWPATLAAPLWVLAATVIALWLTRDRWVLHLVALALGTAAICLGYPPLALLLLTLLIALHHRKPWRQLGIAAAVFCLAYVVGILAVFSLNDLRFGVFGLEIQRWRNPSPLDGLPSLGRHVQRVFENWGTMLRPATLPLIGAGAALVVALRERPLRRRMLVLATALLGGALLNAISTLTDGVDVPPRAMAWFWPILVLIAVWGLEAARPHAKRIAAAVLTFVAVWAAVYSAWATWGRQPAQRALDTLRAAVVSQHRLHPEAPIVFVLSRLRTGAAERQVAWQVGNALAKLDGISRVVPCRGCFGAQGPLDPRDLATWVLFERREVVLQAPGSLRGTALASVREPRWLVPFE